MHIRTYLDPVDPNSRHQAGPPALRAPNIHPLEMLIPGQCLRHGDSHLLLDLVGNPVGRSDGLTEMPQFDLAADLGLFGLSCDRPTETQDSGFGVEEGDGEDFVLDQTGLEELGKE